MENRIFSFLLVLIVVNFFEISTCFSQIANAKPKTYVLDFQAIDLQGKPFYAESLKGKIVLLDFWAVWCPPCIAAFPTLNKLHHELKKDNFEVVGFAAYSGSAEDVSEFLKKYDVDYKILVGDEKVVKRFCVIGYPTYFLINPEGKIHKTYVGEVKIFYERVKTDFQDLKK